MPPVGRFLSRGIFFASRIVMIGKIHSGTISAFENLPRPRAAAAGLDAFQALLQEKMSALQPLERIAVDFLRQALELVLSDGEEKEKDPFLSSPPFSFPLVPGTRNSIQRDEAPPTPSGFEVSENPPEIQDFDPLIEAAARKHNMDPALIRAVIQVESGGNPAAVSPAGARGMMQLMPGTAAEMGVENPFDPAQNIMGGARYLRRLLDRYRGDVKLALAAYNWGMGNVERRPEAMPRETRNFILKVENQVRTS